MDYEKIKKATEYFQKYDSMGPGSILYANGRKFKITNSNKIEEIFEKEEEENKGKDSE